MKKFKNTFTCLMIACCGFTATSCNEVLDVLPTSSFSESLVWSTKNTIESFVFQTYQTVASMWVGAAAIESWTPNGVVSNLTSTTGNNNVNRDLIDNSYDAGFNRFGALRRVNMIIERSVECEALSDLQKAQFVAEGRFLRGLIFYHQALRMGRFVPIREVLTPEDSVTFHTPLTSSIEESYNIILEDFDAAIADLPETSETGRANRYVAAGYKSRACLTAYAYTNNATFLDKAIEAADLVINSGRYALDADYEGMFNEKNGQTSREILFAYYRLSDNTTFGSYPELIEACPNISPDNLVRTNSGPAFANKNGRTFEAWGIYFPTQDLADQYLVIDDLTGEAKPWNQTSQFVNNVVDDRASYAKGYLTAPDPNAQYQWAYVPSDNDMGANTKGEKLREAGRLVSGDRDITDLMNTNRDKRFYGTFVYDKSTHLGEYITTACHGNSWAACRYANGDGQEDSWYTTATGYYWRKYIYQNLRAFYSTPAAIHFTLMRLGEVYLNKAEALLYKGQASAALAVLNNTRTVHGGLPASTASSTDAIWEDYMRERRVEMAYENDFYWSVLRWGKQGIGTEGGVKGGNIIIMNQPVHKLQLSANRDRYFVSQVITNYNWDRNFSERRYLFPIPIGQINTRSAFGIIDQQNPNW